jgi:trk system potassium uptake protein TrkA
MNVVIIGAGEIGMHLAKVLSKERINVTLVDKNPLKLESASSEIDIATRVGDATNWQLLDELLELSPDFLLAMTDSDECNLIACTIAKNLGYPRSMVRLKNPYFLNQTRLDFARIFEIDHFIAPEMLAANDIYKTIATPSSRLVETFSSGAIQLRTIELSKKWRGGNEKLSDLSLPPGVMIGLIRREIELEGSKSKAKQIIFPHGNDKLLAGDEITVIGEIDEMDDIHFFFGVPHGHLRSVVLIGGSSIALNLAKILERKEVDVRIIEKNYERCLSLSESLLSTTIIHEDGTNPAVLEAEKIHKADVVVACTSSDETNITVALLAKKVKSPKVISVIGDAQLTTIIDDLGVTYTAAPRLSAANRILSLLRQQTITSMISLYEGQAEIVEMNISNNSKVAGIPISELGPQFPKSFLLATIQSRGRTFIANGDRVLSPGDTVVVVTNPKHIPELEKVF